MRQQTRPLLLALALSPFLSTAPPSRAQVPAPAQPIIEPSTFTGSPSDALLTQWLTARDPRLNAWAAHFLVENPHPALLPTLQTAILRAQTPEPAAAATATSTRLQGPPDWFEQRALTDLLDALIQTNGTLPPEVTAFVEAQQQAFAEVAQALTAKGLLTEEQRQSLALPIKLFLRDTRQQPAEDLPALAFRRPVQWVPEDTHEP